MKSIQWTIIPLLAVLVFTGCSDDPNIGITDSSLNGTWVLSSTWKTVYNNGNFISYRDNLPYTGGIYTTNDGKMTSQITGIHGNYMAYNYDQYGTKFEAKWYNKAQFTTAIITAIKNYYKRVQPSWSDEYIDEYVGSFGFETSLSSMFSLGTVRYSVNGNTLTVTSTGADNQPYTFTYTRQ